MCIIIDQSSLSMANTDFLQFVLNPETGKLKKYTPKGANKLKLIYSNVMGPRCIRIHILQACQPYLCILKAYNFENFRHYNSRSSLFYALLTTIMVPVMPMLIILGIWHMIEINVDLKNVAATLPLILTLVQMQITFLAIIINNRTISKTIQQIQNVISQRKFLKASSIQCQFFYKFSNWIGCRQSNQTYQLYKKLESKHSLFVGYSGKFLVVVDLVLFVPPALFPISYAIFAYPPPNLWPLPFESQ